MVVEVVEDERVGGELQRKRPPFISSPSRSQCLPNHTLTLSFSQ